MATKKSTKSTETAPKIGPKYSSREETLIREYMNNPSIQGFRQLVKKLNRKPANIYAKIASIRRGDSKSVKSRSSEINHNDYRVDITDDAIPQLPSNERNLERKIEFSIKDISINMENKTIVFTF